VKRLVLALERRVSNDYPWWTPVVALVRRDLVHDWLLEGNTCTTSIPITNDDGTIPGETDRQGMLVGRVHVIPSWHDTVDGNNEQKRLVGDIRAALMLAPEKPADDALDALRDTVVDLVEQAKDRVEVQFALMRTGELRLWYDPEAMPGLDEWDSWLLAEQVYFFIKDIVHDHTHHDPSSDQITPLVQITPAPLDPGHSGDIAWRRETLWSLSREVERLNRDGGLVGLRRSLGMIAYADAFQRSLMGHVRDPIDSTSFRRETGVYDYDFAHLKESIRASVDVAATKKSQAVQLTIAFIATLLSAISVVGSLTSAHNGAQPRPKDGFLRDAFTFVSGDDFVAALAWNPFLTGGIVATLMLGIASMILADGKAGLYNRFQRVISQISRAVSITIVRGSRSQLVVDWLLHVAAICLTFAGVVLCLMIVTSAL
jgi:hypothetical protein